MKRYQFPIPRAALGFAAVALTALTVGAWVIAPTQVEPGTADARTLATAPAIMAAPPEAITRIEGLEVVAARHPTLLTTLVRYFQPAQPKHKQQS